MSSVYLAQPKSYNGTKTFKVGFTKKEIIDSVIIDGKRANVVKFSINIESPNHVKKRLISAFKEKFELEKGREYFNGDISEMCSVFDNIVGNCKTPPKKALKTQKPFLKWVGGKTQIIDKILNKIPSEMNNYHEPFLGGGSVLLSILSLCKEGKIKIKDKFYASDKNSALITVYKSIQTDKDAVYEYFNSYIKTYDGLKETVINRNPQCMMEAKTSKESYYYWIRNQYNTIKNDKIKLSAMFMFLNKTGFRGMYREGPNGYNVPYGHYKKTPSIISKAEMNNLSELIKDVIFTDCGFEDSLKNVKDGDFVYLDPPYAPENSKSFVGYLSQGFDLKSHIKLFDEIKNLGKIKFVMSNAKVKLLTDNFAREEYYYEDVIVRRAINSKNPGSKAEEVIISNFEQGR